MFPAKFYKLKKSPLLGTLPDHCLLVLAIIAFENIF